MVKPFYLDELSHRLNKIMKQQTEQPCRWAWALGFEGIYAISEFADVYSLNLGRCLKPRITGTSKYKKVDLYKNGKRHTYNVHRLVWEAFHGKVPEGYNIDHVDGDRENNILRNLALLSYEDHMLKHKRFEVVALANHHPFRKEYHNELELKEAGFNIARVKKAMKNQTKYNGWYWYPNRGRK